MADAKKYKILERITTGWHLIANNADWSKALSPLDLVRLTSITSPVGTREIINSVLSPTLAVSYTHLTLPTICSV